MADQATHEKQDTRPKTGILTRGRIHLFRVADIDITFDYSWLIIFVLILWSLSAGYFPHVYPNASVELYWIAGFFATLLFFSSIIFHELSHSITAVRHGMTIPEITLFVFGGVAHLTEDPPDPPTELKIALAGPLASIFLAVIFWLIESVLQGRAPELITAVFQYLSWINLALAIFNLVPGYPLDGGRVFRAIVWWKTGSITKATKWASDIGKGFAWTLIFLGALQVFAGALVGGLFLIFIGMFLRGIAATGYRDLLVKQALQDVSVDEVMVREIVTVPPNISLEDAAHDYFLRYGFGGFPVMDNGHPSGMICLTHIKNLPIEERQSKTVAEAMAPLTSELTVAPHDSMADVVGRVNQVETGRLLVMDGENMVGMITKTGVLRFMEIKRALNE